MRIVVIGSCGMLGQMAHSYFSSRYETLVYDRRFTLENCRQWLETLQAFGDAYIINCIGKIKQKSEDSTDLVLANSLLPLNLVAGIAPGQYLIQPTTDCVFSGRTKNQWYEVDAKCDAEDMYGWSKRLGEIAALGHANAYVIRVSIVGIDRIAPQPKGLLGWFLSQPPGAELRGYTNHYWNGITTLEWCKRVESTVFADQERKLTGQILQLGTHDRYSKYQMLELFQRYFGTEIRIDAFETPEAINRCLKPEIVSQPLESQLSEMVDFTQHIDNS